VILAAICLAALLFWVSWQLTQAHITPGYHIHVPRIVIKL
jgi:hypothetical protein